MPYIKKPVKNTDKMERLLLGYGLTPPKLAKIILCCDTTARKKLKDPNQLTTEEWRLINRNGHIPIEEIREVFLS